MTSRSCYAALDAPAGAVALPPAEQSSHPSAARVPASSRSRAQLTLEGLITALDARGARMRLHLGRLPCSGVAGSRGGAALQLDGRALHRPAL